MLRLTQRAPDGWESPRFQAVRVAWSWLRQSSVVSSQPPAGNAIRWALDRKALIVKREFKDAVIGAVGSTMKLSFGTFWGKVILLALGALLLWLIYILFLTKTTLLNDVDLPSPKVLIENATPCLSEGGKQISVKDFEKDKAQIICGEISTDTSPIYLTLVIQPSTEF
jgi:hypothetical protein